MKREFETVQKKSTNSVANSMALHKEGGSPLQLMDNRSNPFEEIKENLALSKSDDVTQLMPIKGFGKEPIQFGGGPGDEDEIPAPRRGDRPVPLIDFGSPLELFKEQMQNPRRTGVFNFMKEMFFENHREQQRFSFLPDMEMMEAFMPSLLLQKELALKKMNVVSEYATDKVDDGMHYAGHKLLNFGADSFKLTHYPDDSWRWMGQKYLFNAGVDVASLLASPIIDATSHFTDGLLRKVPSATMDRATPSHLSTLYMDPSFISYYLEQRKNQLMAPYYLYQDPRAFGKEKYQNMKNFLGVMHMHYNMLDPGILGSLTHGGRALVDFSQDNIAPYVGLSLASFGLYNTGQRRVRTMEMMDHLFPSEKYYGKVARFFPNKLMLTKPLSRVVGNPLLSAAMVAYLLATKLGENKEEMEELRETDPGMYMLLEANNSESFSASTHLGIKKSIERTSSSYSDSPK